MPALLTAYLEPEMEAMFVVASVPAGCPAQPGIVVPAPQIFGRWFVSAPSAVKVSPANAPSPVEIGYGRPDWSVPSKPKVQLLTI